METKSSSQYFFTKIPLNQLMMMDGSYGDLISRNIHFSEGIPEYYAIFHIIHSVKSTFTPNCKRVNCFHEILCILMKFINRAPGVRETVINLIIVKNS